MARYTLIRRLSCITAAAGTAMLLVIASAGASTAQAAVAANVPASSVRLSAGGPSSGHSLTRLVAMTRRASPDAVGLLRAQAQKTDEYRRLP